MFSIPRDSEAFRTLEAMVNDPNTRYIRVAVREPDPAECNCSSGILGFNVHREGCKMETPTICLSGNQGMWTPPLATKAVNF
jgi:hypothetical protein